MMRLGRGGGFACGACVRLDLDKVVVSLKVVPISSAEETTIKKHGRSALLKVAVKVMINWEVGMCYSAERSK